MGRYRVKIDPLTDLSLIPSDWPEVYTFLEGSLFPVLEIGSGMGEFLVSMAEKNPQHTFLGIEMQYKRVLKGTEEIWKRGLANIKFFHRRVDENLAEHLGSYRFKKIIINHPDPWVKRRQHKHRIVRESMLSAFNRLLDMDAALYISTDHREYAEVIEKLLQNSTFFQLDQNLLEDEIQDFLQTRFAKKLASKGFPSRIFRAIKVKDQE